MDFTDDRVDLMRRRMLGTAALTLSAGPSGLSLAAAPRRDPPTAVRSTRQVNAGELSVGIAETGPASGRPVILLHGWPYDIHMFAEAAAMLGDAGFRTITPYLRGFGATRFLS